MTAATIASSFSVISCRISSKRSLTVATAAASADRVEERVNDHPGVTLPVCHRSQPSVIPKIDEHRQAQHEPVGEPERDAGDEDRRPRPDERRQEPEAEAAEEELLDERRHEHDDGGVRQERHRPARVPGVGHETLLVSGVEERAQRRRRGDDHDERDERRADGPRRAPRERSSASSGRSRPCAIARIRTNMIPYWISAPTNVDQR